MSAAADINLQIQQTLIPEGVRSNDTLEKDLKEQSFVKKLLLADVLSQGAVLVGLFSLYTSQNLVNFLNQSSLHYFIFPFLGVSELVILGVSGYYFAKAKNRNWQVTSRLVVDFFKVSMIVAAVVGGTVAPVAFSAAAPILFMAALSLVSAYHIGLAFWLNSKVNKLKDTSLEKQYRSERNIHIKDAILLAIIVASIGFLMLNPVGGSLGIAIAAITVAAIFSNVAYTIYNSFKNKKTDALKYLNVSSLEDSHANLDKNDVSQLIKSKIQRINDQDQCTSFFEMLKDKVSSASKRRAVKKALLLELQAICDETDVNIQEQMYGELVGKCDGDYSKAFQSFFSYIGESAKIMLTVAHLIDENKKKLAANKRGEELSDDPSETLNTDDLRGLGDGYGEVVVENPLAINTISNPETAVIFNKPEDKSWEEYTTERLNIGMGF